MIAQTNLQLYRQITSDGYSNEDLRRVRNAYDLACHLFGHRFRPSGKPFVCHLVGVASGLCVWGERPSVVIAGLLHSCYLYGDFGDFEKLDSPKRRQHVRSIVGVEAEQLIRAYTQAKGRRLFDLQDRDLQVLVLADLLDELADAGPSFAAAKRIPELSNDSDGAPYDDAAITRVLNLSESLVGPNASERLRRAIADCRQANTPQCLSGNKQSSYSVTPGVESLRLSSLERRWQKITRQWRLGKAA